MKINFETKPRFTVLKEQIKADCVGKDPKCILTISRYSNLNIVEIKLIIKPAVGFLI